jgi:Ca2+-binding RTX toxin-like protein
MKARLTLLAVTAVLCALASLAGSARALAAPPSNDNFSAATVITGTEGSLKGPNKGTNVEATKEVGEPNHAGLPGGASVWYQWTAPANGRLFLNTGGSGFDTLLAVYTGAVVNALAEVTSNDDASAATLTSALSFMAIGGTTYEIAVDGFGGQSGTIVLAWIQGPSNDDFANAQAIVGIAGTVSGTNEIATVEAGEPKEAGNNTTSIWYRWTAPTTASFVFDTFGSERFLDTTLGVYRGNNLVALTRVRANDDIHFSDNLTSAVGFRAQRNVTYSIRIGGYSEDDTGDTVLNWRRGRLIKGTARGNVLTGTPYSDLILSGGGNDVVYGRAGNDEVDADGGKDIVNGGFGADWIRGGGLSDVLRGGPGRDLLDARDGVRGNDLLFGGLGLDTCRADQGDRKTSCP